MGNAIKELIKDVERLDELESHRKERNVINHIRDTIGANFDGFIALYENTINRDLIHRYLLSDIAGHAIFTPYLRGLLKHKESYTHTDHEKLEPFFLFTGYYLYVKAAHASNQDIALKKAIDYHSIHALQHWVSNFSKEIHKAASDNEFIELAEQSSEYFDRICQEAIYHGTPALILGFLLCNQLQQVAAKYHLHGDVTSYGTNGLGFLKAAAAMERACPNSINHAYFGQGLSASNTNGIENLEESANKILKTFQTNHNQRAQVSTHLSLNLLNLCLNTPMNRYEEEQASTSVRYTNH